MRLQFNLITNTEQSSIRVIPMLDQQSSTPLLLYNFSSPKARPKSSSRDQHTQEQHRRTPRGKMFVTKASNTGGSTCAIRGEATRRFSLDLLSKNHTEQKI